MANFVKTSFLLAVMTALFMGVGYLLGGNQGMAIAFVIAAGMNLFSWWNSGKMVLRMHNAREVDGRSAPQLVNIVAALAKRADLPMPRVYVIETSQPNAFATGRSPKNAAVAASTGLLDALNEEEVAAVMAHELAHIKSRDTLTMTVVATFAGAIGMLANFAFFFRGNRDNPFGFIGILVAMIVAPMAAAMVQMAISRTREYEADRDGAEICGNPMSLASALEKIETMARQRVNMSAEAAPATAHLFIINPLSGARMDNLFSTHPNTANRIAALKQLRHEMIQPDPHQERFEPQGRSETTRYSPPQREVWGRNAGEMRKPRPAERARSSRSGSVPRSTSGSTRRGPWG